MPSLVATRFLALPGALIIVTGILPATMATAAAPERPEILGLTHYKGELHAHTGLTYTEPGNLPAEVFAQIEAEGKLDFYAATEKAGLMDVSGADDFIDDISDAESAEWRELFAQTDAWNAGDHDLVGVAGQEVGWANLTSGHINVFNAEWLIAPEARGGGWGEGKNGEIQWDLLAFYARLKADPDAIAQFNHPSTTGYGTFDEWRHLDRQLDEQFELFEYKQNDAEYLQNWHDALDAGWHVAPTWNGDEHGHDFDRNAARSGIWATEHSLEGLYDAMHRRSLYATFDETAWVALTANGEMMGSILPRSTTELDLEVHIGEPDDVDDSGTVTFYGNGGAVLHTASYSGRDALVEVSLPVTDGDWVYAHVVQADGDLLVSAPIWVGDTVRGADYAPEIELTGPALRTAQPGELVTLPAVSATDDSGAEPTISMEVFTGDGLVPLEDGAFRINGFDDHVVVIKATDAAGNSGSQLVRYTVEQAGADPEDAFRHMDIANVGQHPGEVGISVVTDQRIEQAWVQVRKVGTTWDDATTVESTGRRAFDVERQGRPGAFDQNTVSIAVLRNHEFRMTGLDAGASYEYRFALDPATGWTDVRGGFTAGGFDDAPIYLLGDLQVEAGSPAEYELFPGTLDVLQREHPGGDLLVQVGDLVNFGGYYHQWKGSFDLSLAGIDLQYAGMVGNHETQRDMEAHDKIALQRTQIFSGMFANPLNGVNGEGNYSFDRGDIHFAVLNSMYDMDEQLQWLVDDMRATDKTWKVVLGHFSYYGGDHAGDAKLVLDRGKIAPVLQQLGVDMYIGGHDHIYKRSTIYDGRLAVTPEEEALGTTYVTLGSAGPKFYDNIVWPWDDVLFDENVQVGSVLEATDEGLRLSSYTLDGRTVDEVLVTQPEAHWAVTSADIRGGLLRGIGLTSYAESRSGPVTVTVGVYDAAQDELLDMRTVTVTLRQRGGEQLARFDTPIRIDPRTTIKAFTWDTLGGGEPLRAPYLIQEGIDGSGTAEDPYQVRTVADMRNVANDLDAHYLLMNDLVFDDIERATIGTEANPFTGVFDGGGHEIGGLRTSNLGAQALFGVNSGTIRYLGVVDVALDLDVQVAGILATSNTGTIERVHTTGSITSRTRVGGIVGDQAGILRDSWSTATVTGQTRVGGLVGSAMDTSVTERAWFAGSVTVRPRNSSSTATNGGGIAGFLEVGSTVRDSIVLAGTISGNQGQAIAGQSQTPSTLSNNLVSSAVTVVGPQRGGATGAETLKGEPIDSTLTADATLYSGRLGWDLETVWRFDTATGRPMLNPEG